MPLLSLNISANRFWKNVILVIAINKQKHHPTKYTFGFLYTPFDYFIRLINVFFKDYEVQQFVFPSFEIMGFVVWNDLTFDLVSIPVVSNILGIVRAGMGVVIVGAFISYLRSYFDKRFGGGG